MIVHETATHQVTVEFKLLKVPRQQGFLHLRKVIFINLLEAICFQTILDKTLQFITCANASIINFVFFFSVCHLTISYTINC